MFFFLNSKFLIFYVKQISTGILCSCVLIFCHWCIEVKVPQEIVFLSSFPLGVGSEIMILDLLYLMRQKTSPRKSNVLVSDTGTQDLRVWQVLKASSYILQGEKPIFTLQNITAGWETDFLGIQRLTENYSRYWRIFMDIFARFSIAYRTKLIRINKPYMSLNSDG